MVETIRRRRRPTRETPTLRLFLFLRSPGARLVSEWPDEEPVTITEIQANAPGNDSENLNGEFVTVQKTGDTAIDLSGFILTAERYGGKTTRLVASPSAQVRRLPFGTGVAMTPIRPFIPDQPRRS
jgi:hypothetical protein